MGKKLKEKIVTFPDKPGIYQFFDTQKKLIYVGKATSLKHRVRSYFAGARTPRPIEQMMDQVADITYVQTDSVLEAVILESLHIKKYKPKYNVLGKDDKSWNYITISKDEYPIVDTMRQHEYKKMQKSNDRILKNFAYVFGPYPGLNTKATMKLLRRLFQFSTCHKSRRSGKRTRPCLYYQMGQCLGVCIGEIGPKAYKQKVIRPLVTFLKGNKKKVIQDLEIEMKKAAKKNEYEEAARLRDQLESLNRIHDIAMLNVSFFKDVLQQVDFVVERIEGYDISNLGSSGVVGSMVVFDASGPVKSQYRKFKIRTFEGQSDVGALKEVLDRRLNHDEWPLPQIFLIDGGLPQVNAVKQILLKRNISVPVVGIAKGPARKKNEFILGDKDKHFVKWVQDHAQLLTSVRDEAHRFAVRYQRSSRKIK